MTKRCLALLTLFSWALSMSAQENSREKTAKGSYTYEIPKSMSYEQACQAALIKAQNDAIAEAFGLSMSESNDIFISNIDGKSSTSFHSTSQGSVRGVWLADETAPKYEKFLQDGRDWVKVTVKGKAREIVSAGIDFEVAPIRYKADKELATVAYSGAKEQLWRVEQLTDGTYRIMPYAIPGLPGKNQKYCLYSAGDSTPTLAEYDFKSDNSKWNLKKD